jgi:hypothetical protein
MFLGIGATSYSCWSAFLELGELIVKSARFGKDFDLKIAEWVASKFEEKNKGK